MAVAIAYKPDRLTFYRGYSWDFTAQIQTPDPLNPKVLVVPSITGWTAELEIRDEKKVRKVRLQTSPAPPGAPSATTDGTIVVDTVNNWFSIQFSSTAEALADGAYLIEARAFDGSGTPWPLIPVRPCDIIQTVLIGGS